MQGSGLKMEQIISKHRVLTVMLLIFMSEHMFRSRDQSVKIQREFFRYTRMALCFFYPHLVPIPHLATRM